MRFQKSFTTKINRRERILSEKNKTPWLTLSLIGINLLIALLALVNPITDRFAFNPAAPNLYTPLTSLFLHTNTLHLMGNLIFLAAVGPFLEFARGAWRLLIVYLLSGLIGVLAHSLFARTSGDSGLLIGASGCIAGVLGYCSLRYIRTRVPIGPNLGIPVGYLALLWVLLQGMGAYIKIGDGLGASTAYWAHLAGFLTGLVLAVAFQEGKHARLRYGHEVLEKMNLRGPAAALAALDQHLISHPKDINSWLKKATCHEDMGEQNEAVDALLQSLKLSSPDDRAGIVDRLIALNGHKNLSPTERMKLADEFKVCKKEIAESLYLSVAEHLPEDVRRPDAILALYELTQKSQLLEVLTQDYPLHPATLAAQNKGWIS